MPQVDKLEQEFHTAVERQQTGDLTGAEALYRAVLKGAPDNVATLMNFGVLLKDLGRNEEALAPLEKAVSLMPEYPDAQNNLGAVLLNLNEVERATAYFRQALALKPDFASAHQNLGVALDRSGSMEAAGTHYQRALALQPDSPEAHNNFGQHLHARGDKVGAIAHFKRAVELKPDDAAALANFANGLREQGRTEEAVAVYEQAMAHDPDNTGLKIKHALVLPVIPQSSEEIAHYRGRLISSIDRLEQAGVVVDDPLYDVGQSTFYLAYHGLESRSIQEQVARFFEKTSPSLLYTAAHCRGVTVVPKDRRIHIGIISRHFREHAVAWCFLDFARLVPKDRFKVTLIKADLGTNDVWQEMTRWADDALEISHQDIDAARQQIADLKLDALIYTDIGMDPFTYFLAFARLAPVQCALPGHPFTTGVPNVDYYLSPGWAEAEGAEAHYSERLIRLKDTPSYYRWPKLPDPMQSRDAFGLPEGRTLYLCPQTLFKFHPEFDAILAGILRGDPNGELVLAEGGFHDWHKLLLQRFERSMPDVLSRIRILPRVPLENFLNLLMLGDVVLDTIHFTGGNTTFQTFAVGTPIVTMPTTYMSGRGTAGMYELMGIHDCVAHSPEEYVEIALRLGRDRAYREELRGRILDASDVLFENPAGIEDIVSFLESRLAR